MRECDSPGLARVLASRKPCEQSDLQEDVRDEPDVVPALQPPEPARAGGPDAAENACKRQQWHVPDCVLDRLATSCGGEAVGVLERGEGVGKHDVARQYEPGEDYCIDVEFHRSQVRLDGHYHVRGL
jgi:hypothetical protein